MHVIFYEKYWQIKINSKNNNQDDEGYGNCCILYYMKNY